MDLPGNVFERMKVIGGEFDFQDEEAEAEREIKRLEANAAEIAEPLEQAKSVKEACVKRREKEARRKAEALRLAENERKERELEAKRYTGHATCMLFDRRPS